jgi:hypothetical protein
VAIGEMRRDINPAAAPRLWRGHRRRSGRRPSSISPRPSSAPIFCAR